MTSPTHLTPSADNIVRYTVLESGIPVPERLYESVRRQVEERCRELDKNGIYTSEQLCGSDFWNHWSTGEEKTDGVKRTAGQCISSMAETKVLPLMGVPGKHEYPKLYKII
jgi:hypothetical protein